METQIQKRTEKVLDHKRARRIQNTKDTIREIAILAANRFHTNSESEHFKDIVPDFTPEWYGQIR